MTAVVPTVSIARAELDRLRELEKRAKGCKLILKTDAELLARDRRDQVVSKAELDRQERMYQYVGGFIGWILGEQ